MVSSMTYSPILRNRQVELKAIEDVLSARSSLSSVIIPLIEVIQEKTRSNSKNCFIEDICEIARKHSDIALLVDINRRQPNSSMAPAVRNFLFESSRNTSFVRKQLELLLNNELPIIPTVSLNPISPDYEQFQDDVMWLHETYPGRVIAYRVLIQSVNRLLPIVQSSAKPGEVFILDIADTADPMHGLVRQACFSISKITRQIKMRFIIVDDPRPQSLLNKNIENNAPIFSIGTSLKATYHQQLKADGFGDYAGIASSYPATGGAISPAAVFYDCASDVFMGFRGATSNLYEFSGIAKSIVHSAAWASLSPAHLDGCPGCKKIMACAFGEIGHGSQASWKQYTMEHYIYSMGEFMLAENAGW